MLNKNMPKEGMIKQITGEYERSRSGWKIHISGNPNNHKTIYDWLLKNSPYGCKYLSNSEQTGKDFTIYVGSWMDTVDFAARIHNELGNILDKIKGDALNDDLKITDKVAARFDTNLDGFHQYGTNGLPYLKEDIAKSTGLFGYKKENFNKKEALRKSFDILNRTYGTYFSGPNQRVKEFVGI